jgi:hypothetical protein
MRWIAAVIVLLSARELTACSIGTFDPNRVMENTPVYSANGRFCAIVRWHDRIPDFGKRLAGELFNPDAESIGEPDVDAPKPVTIAFYESKTLLAEIPIDVDVVGDVLVSDSGRYFVVVQRPRGCGGWIIPDKPLLTIYKSNGSTVATRQLADFATPYDVIQLAHGTAAIEFALRPESGTREVIVISFPMSQTEIVERRVDIGSGALLDEKRPLFPEPRATVAPPSEPSSADFDPASPACVDAGAVKLDSTQFLARAVDQPLPLYPIVALKARISGFVRIEAVVSEKGQVLCTRHSRLPFGLDTAADEAVSHWIFKPMSVDGKRVRYRGEVVIRFK